MNLAEYFENIKGTGILSTSDSEGNVDAAIYTKPYTIDEQTIAFSMMEHLSYMNIKSNPKACYMFIEKTEGFKGLRIYLTMTGEETDEQKIREIKQMHSINYKPDERRHLVYFRVENTWPLVGNKADVR
jgi:hypothetical protein